MRLAIALCIYLPVLGQWLFAASHGVYGREAAVALSTHFGFALLAYLHRWLTTARRS